MLNSEDYIKLRYPNKKSEDLTCIIGANYADLRPFVISAVIGLGCDQSFGITYSGPGVRL